MELITHSVTFSKAAESYGISATDNYYLPKDFYIKRLHVFGSVDSNGDTAVPFWETVANGYVHIGLDYYYFNFLGENVIPINQTVLATTLMLIKLYGNTNDNTHALFFKYFFIFEGFPKIAT